MSTGLSLFGDFPSKVQRINVGHVADRPKTLSPAEWAQAIFDHWKTQQPKGKSVSEEAFAEHAKLSRGGFRKLLDGDNRPRFDTVQKLRAVAPSHLKNLEPSQPVESRPMSDPDRKDLPPGLEAFLERHGHRLDPAERDFLGGISFSRGAEKIRMDDAWWWDFVSRLGLSGGKKSS